MTTPFRDDLAAALERVSELEAENVELRARLAKFDEATASHEAEMDTALTTTHGLAARLQRENEELRAELEKSRRLAAGLPVQAPKATGPVMVLVALNTIAFFAASLAWLIEKLGHC